MKAMTRTVNIPNKGFAQTVAILLNVYPNWKKLFGFLSGGATEAGPKEGAKLRRQHRTQKKTTRHILQVAKGRENKLTAEAQVVSFSSP